MVVYTVGTFDLLHVGKLALLEYCKTLGDVVAVGVASDNVVNSYKPNVPVVPLEQRMEMLKALRCVDIVRPYHELEYVSGCKELNPDIFVIVFTANFVIPFLFFFFLFIFFIFITIQSSFCYFFISMLYFSLTNFLARYKASK